ncbi:predicted protein [Clavispora lusitaniae ATCC 42720]|uniref:Uncharacterized protein n=1 Tax=Clavispora lusitaniae (strain ATCC 42720) TaxID=306902 RepID=C4XX00_CLAL4|nr:uncharacterized protein CLUG_00473 [Clavispora lusitaniae ATCC 42720]EEQ36350.1 predicted protein [Clavispora lusitaniae ATCC 42720]
MAPGKWGHGRAVCRRQMFNFPVSYRLRFMQSQAQIHTVRQYVGYTVSYSQAHMVGPSYSLCHTVFAIQSLPYSHVNICPAAARAISIGGPWSHQPIQQSKQQTNQPNQKVKEPTRPVSSKSPTDQMPNPRKTKSPYRQKNQICSIHPISHLR